MGGVARALVRGGANTSRADFVGEQERPSGVMAEVTASNPACRVCSMCASLPPGTQRVISSAYIELRREGMRSSVEAREERVRLNRRGERTAPWGVPRLGILKAWDWRRPSLMVAVRLLRKLERY